MTYIILNGSVIEFFFLFLFEIKEKGSRAREERRKEIRRKRQRTER